MQNESLYHELLNSLQTSLEVLQDKPDENPLATLRALWYTAAGTPRSVQASLTGDLPDLTPQAVSRLRQDVARRLGGEPLAHIIQRQQFMGVELLAGPEALIPRIETELLGRATLELVQDINKKQGASKVIDVCTGSGNLAIAYAVHAPESRIYAADLSVDAVDLARRNAKFAGVAERVEFRDGDLLGPFDDNSFHDSIDVLSCNPPYISSAKVDLMHEEISRYEPRLAFDGGPFGVKILQRLIQEAPKYIKPCGWLTFEVGLGQGPAWSQRLMKNPNYTDVKTVNDADGQVRVVMAQRANNPDINKD